MAKSDSEVSICFPGETRWELWRLNSGRFVLADTAELEEDGTVEPFKAASHYAFPVHSVFASPIWAATDDPALLGNIVEMQLEKNGLKPEPGPGVMLDYRKVGGADAMAPSSGIDAAVVPRSLVLAKVLNPSYSHPLPRSGAHEFDVSPRFLVLPGNHLAIWKELGRLVIALTRGGQLIYFQGLTATELDPGSVHEIHCILLGLEGQGITAAPAGIHVWLDEIDDEIGAMLQQELGCEALVGLRPDPVLPELTSSLLPPEVAMLRRQKQQARKIRNIALVAAACYLALLGWYFFDYFRVVAEEKQLAAQAGELAPQAASIADFESRWNAFENVIESGRYPSELLHICTGDLPPKGVRFTSFGVQGGTITIIAEAENPNAGRVYGAKLFKNSLLSDYDWIWLQRPTVDPKKKDGTASFRIQGSYKFSKA